VELLGDKYEDIFDEDIFDEDISKTKSDKTDKTKQTKQTKSDKIKSKSKSNAKSNAKSKQTGGGRKKNLQNELETKPQYDIYDPLETDIDNLHMFINTNRRLVTINDNIPDLSNYDIKNNREICPTNTKNACNLNYHCQWKSGSCLFKTTTKQIIEYVNKISEELTNNELKSNEILSQENYFVSDIVNREY
jgi:hypothetical protein